MNKSIYLGYLFLIIFVSCTKHEFSAIKNQETNTAPLTFTNSDEICAQYTLIKPEVDYLFLWDNSSSQTFVTDETKAALNNTIDLISDRFDYHIVLAPLIIGDNEDINTNQFLIAYNKDGLNESALDVLVDRDQAADKLSNYTTSSSAEEHGAKRAVDIINANIENGIFRKNAYTLIVVMSNGNDQFYTSMGLADGKATSDYKNEQVQSLIKLRDETLSGSEMRFISLVAHSSCKTGWRTGETYKDISSEIYISKYGSSESGDQQGSNTPDSFDICNEDFLHLFDGPNNIILDTVIQHQYDYWPISAVETPLAFDPNTLVVKKSNGDEYFEVAGESSGTGWKYVGYLEDQPTRFEPSSGEFFTGHLVQLFGDAKVTYPECLMISSESPTYYYGYIKLATKPLEDSIKVTINGITVNESTSDGWEYIGYQPAMNIKIQGPNNPSDTYQSALPEENENEGYFLKIHGNAIYSSGANIEVIYDPSSE
jgi:hypothetical protein